MPRCLVCTTSAAFHELSFEGKDYPCLAQEIQTLRQLVGLLPDCAEVRAYWDSVNRQQQEHAKNMAEARKPRA